MFFTPFLESSRVGTSRQLKHAACYTYEMANMRRTSEDGAWEPSTGLHP